MKGTLTQTTPQQRVVRVFVSSTFHDMKVEREELVKRVFPKLRKICEKRGVTWGAVDLRWGITDEQLSAGKMLPICLKEIDECIPFFIGVLGERYGSIPDEIPDELLERQPWLKDHTEASVTAIEMLHGALNDPGKSEHVHFYFRDPSYVLDKPDHMKADHPEKLIALKDQIRRSGLPVRENYPDPKELGKLVYEDLLSIIDELYPEGSELDPLDRDALDHDLFAYSRHKTYIPRQEYYDRLNAHVEGDDQPLVVLGESGSGKSALLANWITNYRGTNPENLFTTHYIGATPYSADWAAMLRRIMGEFKRRYDIHGDIPDASDKLRSTFANWLHMASTAAGNKNEKIIIILDALNQLEDREAALDLVWLPPMIPENIRMILSTLPGRPLDDLKKREWPTMEVHPLTDDERTTLISGYLGEFSKSLNEDREGKIALAEQTRNPLYLRSLLEELSVFGVHEHLDRAIEHYISAETIPELFEKVLKRIERDYGAEWPGLVEDAMTLIWASRRGLTEEELLELCGAAGNVLPSAQWHQFYSAVERLLVNSSGLISFAHDYIREAIRERYLHKEKARKNSHRRIADYFSEQNLTSRKIAELTWQLAESEEWQLLYDLLADLEFFHAAWKDNEFEVRAYWAKIENSSDLKLVDAYQFVMDAPEEDSNLEAVKSMADLFYGKALYTETWKIYEFLIEMYRKANQEMEVAAIIRGQGNILTHRGDHNEAIKLFKKSEFICRNIVDYTGLSTSLNNQGMVLIHKGDFLGAMQIFRESEKITRKLDDKTGLATNLTGQGVIQKGLGEYEQALMLIQEAEVLYRALGNKDGLSGSLGRQGSVLIMLGDLDRALKLQQEVEVLCRQLGNKINLSASLGSQGTILEAQDDLEGALRCQEESEALCREAGYIMGLAFSLGNQGIIQGKLGNYDRCAELTKEVENISRKYGFVNVLTECLINQSNLFLLTGSLDRALAAATEAHELAIKHEYSGLITKIKTILAEIQAAMDEKQKSVDGS